MGSLKQQYGDTVGYLAFAAMHEAGIKYCIWKSMDRFGEGVRGETDFDVLVDKQDHDKVMNLLAGMGWIRLRAESWRSFPDIHDFICYEPRYQRFAHIHMHFRLISGEMRIKNLEIPLQDLYLDNLQHEGPIHWTIPEIQLIVLCLRIADKTRSLDAVHGLIPLGPGLEKFKEEYEELQDACEPSRLQSLLEDERLSLAPRAVLEHFLQDITGYKRNDRRTVRKSIRSWARYRGLAYVRVYLERLIMRRVEGMGKRLYTGGLSVAVVGGDGSGKSTLVEQVRKRLSQHMKVEHVYMGGSPDSRGVSRGLLRLTLFPVIAVLWRMLSVLGGNLDRRVQNFYYSLEERLIVGEKSRRYQHGERARRRGEMVLYERFPIFSVYGDRGDDLGNAKFRRYLDGRYEQFKMPDLIIGLDVDADTAVRRKPDHPEQMVRDKMAVFSGYFSECRERPGMLILDATAPLDSLVDQVCEYISVELARDR